MKRALAILVILLAAALLAGSLRNRNFWTSPDARGEALRRDGKFAEAAKEYSDPWRIGIAQYRDGDFKEAAVTFARVPGAIGAFDQGNANLMHGAYDAAVASYDRALSFHPGWKDAEENRALALARKARIDKSGEGREKESTDAYTPDKIVFDLKAGQDKKAEPPQDMNGESLSDEDMRATWLRKVKTTPGDFLRAKFAYQDSRVEQKEARETKGEEAK